MAEVNKAEKSRLLSLVCSKPCSPASKMRFGPKLNTLRYEKKKKNSLRQKP